MAKYGSWRVVLGSTRYSPSRYHPPSHYPGYTPPPPTCRWSLYSRCTGHAGRTNMVVGLKSVRQLTLGTQISDIRGITEVYNLVKIGRIINHFSIPGNE